MNQSELKGKTAVKVLSLVAGGCALVNLLILLFRGFIIRNILWMLCSCVCPMLVYLAPAALLAIFALRFYQKEKARLFVAMSFFAVAAAELLNIGLCLSFGESASYISSLLFQIIFFALAGAGILVGFSQKVLPIIAVFAMFDLSSINFLGSASKMFRVLEVSSGIDYVERFFLQTLEEFIMVGSLCMAWLIILLKNELPAVERRVRQPYIPYQQPVYQQPAYQQPAPAYQQPVQQPVYQQPVYQQPIQQPVYQPSAPSVATAPAAPAVSPTQRALMKLTEQYCQGQISAEEYRVQQKLLTDLLNEEQ